MAIQSLALGGSLLATAVGERAVDRVGKTLRCSAPLHDVVHCRVPRAWARYERLTDALPALVGGLVAYLAWRGEVDLARLAALLAAAFALRCVTMSVTVLPSPICQGTQRAGALGGCHGCIFSGHTATTLLLAHAAATARPELAPALLAYCVAASACIVASRAHYSVDVVVAWIAVAALV